MHGFVLWRTLRTEKILAKRCHNTHWCFIPRVPAAATVHWIRFPVTFCGKCYTDYQKRNALICKKLIFLLIWHINNAPMGLRYVILSRTIFSWWRQSNCTSKYLPISSRSTTLKSLRAACALFTVARWRDWHRRARILIADFFIRSCNVAYRMK